MKLVENVIIYRRWNTAMKITLNQTNLLPLGLGGVCGGGSRSDVILLLILIGGSGCGRDVTAVAYDDELAIVRARRVLRHASEAHPRIMFEPADLVHHTRPGL